MEKVKIGKNIMENLTLGMYVDSKIVFREYIQNAADQIDYANENNLFLDDELQIEILIDVKDRNIKIKDNATGIKSSEVFSKLANVADSKKDRDKDKGFRGIGRLGGLAYCEELVFTTSYKGEKIKTIMRWDANTFRKLINDKSVKDDAQEILKRIISFETEECKEEDHYFIVELKNVNKENEELLDINQVRDYISSSAPIPFDTKFIFRSKIQDFIKENNLKLDEYSIHLNGINIFKNYRTHLYEKSGDKKRKYDEIYDVQFEKFHNDKGELLAWIWFGISAFEKQIPESVNEMRGIRLKKANIQLGDSSTFANFFPQTRTNYYFIGEVHAVHKDLVPNARRDFFNENESRNEFEEIIKSFFSDKLFKLVYGANKVKNFYKKEFKYIEAQSEYNDKLKEGFADKEEKKKVKEELIKAEEEKSKALEYVNKEIEKAKLNETYEKVIKIIEKKHKDQIDGLKNDYNSDKDDDEVQENHEEKFITDDLHRLDKKQRKLISRVYKVIKATLPKETGEELIKKIQNELNSNEEKNTIN